MAKTIVRNYGNNKKITLVNMHGNFSINSTYYKMNRTKPNFTVYRAAQSDGCGAHHLSPICYVKNERTWECDEYFPSTQCSTVPSIKLWPVLFFATPSTDTFLCDLGVAPSQRRNQHKKE